MTAAVNPTSRPRRGLSRPRLVRSPNRRGTGRDLSEPKAEASPVFTIDDLVAIPHNQVLFARNQFHSLTGHGIEFSYNVTLRDGRELSCILMNPRKEFKRTSQTLFGFTGKTSGTYTTYRAEYDQGERKFRRFLARLTKKRGFFLVQSSSERPIGTYRDIAVLNANAIDSYRHQGRHESTDSEGRSYMDKDNPYRGLIIESGGKAFDAYGGDGITTFIGRLVVSGYAPNVIPLTLEQEQQIKEAAREATGHMDEASGLAALHQQRARQALSKVGDILDLAAHGHFAPEGPVGQALALRQQLLTANL